MRSRSIKQQSASNIYRTYSRRLWQDAKHSKYDFKVVQLVFWAFTVCSWRGKRKKRDQLVQLLLFSIASYATGRSMDML